MNSLIDWAERRWIPDWLLRHGIRRLLRQRLRQTTPTPEAMARILEQCPLAIQTDAANQQHYEVPPEFFQWVLGPRMKYSCGLWLDPSTTLAESEEAMLAETCRRAQIVDGMDILELGCGWGSLSLWLAEKFPACRILAISNSHSQRRFIEEKIHQRKLNNLEVLTRDIRDLQLNQRFDRILSVEMFEHLRNFRLLFDRLAGWVNPEGKLFVHIFCHRELSYFFEDQGSNDWMARNFFTGGIMPAEGLLPQFQQHFHLDHQWRVNGRHYALTLEAWLNNLDRHRDRLVQILGKISADPHRDWQRWRMFMLACAELFNYRNGEEWFVAHYLFELHAAAHPLTARSEIGK